jgi:hypothetical protein
LLPVRSVSGIRVICSRPFLPCQVYYKLLYFHSNLLQDLLPAIFSDMIFRHHAVRLKKSVFASMKGSDYVLLDG